MDKKLNVMLEKTQPDFLFEVSWEVCNKVGGIYTVISTKAPFMVKEYNDQFMMIGPDLLKEGEVNPDFKEDTTLLCAWKEKAAEDGLKFRIGHWSTPGEPIVILVDYSSLFAQKDAILEELWNKNRVDSISGGWDYFEPVLFGYSAGKVIESYLLFHLTSEVRILAQFHEWMTASGVLYLENTVPEVATVFTTHATVAGRSIAGQGWPFYSQFESYNGDQVAKVFNVTSKHSMEKTAAMTADCFTTVSDFTARECKQLLGKTVDFVTINGFDSSFVPPPDQFEDKRKEARKMLLEVASAVVGYKLNKNSVLLATSGRYEYKNKGIDLFINSLAALNQKSKLSKDVVAFILVPAGHTSPREGVQKRQLTEQKNLQYQSDDQDQIATHYLSDTKHDPIVQEVNRSGLNNGKDQKVKVIFVPTYLDGNDGVFNRKYYDLLIGFDITAFPSYYEPFGYTPLESVAFSIPTITTTLTGFGAGVRSRLNNFKRGMLVVERTDFNNQTVIEQMTNYIIDFCDLTEKEVIDAREKAYEISNHSLWKNQVKNYELAYRKALKRFQSRESAIDRILQNPPGAFITSPISNNPEWKSLFVDFKVPEALQNLEALSKNLWWTWNHKAEVLFASINREKWEEVDHNPVALLHELSYQEFDALEKEPDFMERLNAVSEKMRDYLAKKTDETSPLVAYFCMEYGLHSSLKLYSGGLGILAGDYLKEASDQNVNIVAIGLLYRYGYFHQSLTVNGEQVACYNKEHFTELPIMPVLDKEGDRIIVEIPVRATKVRAQVWEVNVGRVPLYLLDTDIPENEDEIRSITNILYGGNKEHRLQQEILLGTGGIILLKILGIKPDIFHLNEGHSAFAGLTRGIQFVIEKNLKYKEAFELVKATTLFTTHTPVPAGHDTFSEDLFRIYQSHMPGKLSTSWEYMLGLGKVNPSDPNEKFSMSYLAAHMAEEINGVSKIHAEVTRKMFKSLWKGFQEDELDIDYITNGVHYSTWTAPEWQHLFADTLDKDFLHNAERWEKIDEIPDKKIFEVKSGLKKNLILGFKKKLKPELKSLHIPPSHIYDLLNALQENDLILGFARRFASYKRATLLFSDLDRLKRIVGNNEKPVKIIFAGKAHPADKEGQDMIKKIIRISKSPGFIGKIYFIQNYDMAMARLLVQGVDVWLNMPERGKEASGTSGMKATLNGTLNFSIMDGWWAEAYRPDAGWALPPENTFDGYQDQYDLDAETIYNILEHEIVPSYYNVNEQGFSPTWVARMKNAWKYIAPHYTTTRMLQEYRDKYYSKMYLRKQKLTANGYEQVKELVDWEKKMNEGWNKISVVDMKLFDTSHPLQLGEEVEAEVTLDVTDLPVEDIGVELVLAKSGGNGVMHIKNKQEFQLKETRKHHAVYTCNVRAPFSGTYKYDVRVYPKSAQLQYRRDLPLVKWL